MNLCQVNTFFLVIIRIICIEVTIYKLYILKIVLYLDYYLDISIQGHLGVCIGILVANNIMK